MAEKSAGRTLVSSIHSDDLLSDMELLPASAPPTPMQKAPRQYNSPQSATPYTSKVTTQLYASLQQSRQAEAQARSHLEGQHGSGLAREAEVDLDTLAEEMSHRLSTSVETSAYRKAGAAESHHIVEMESVRCHLQSMLRGSREAAHGDAAALGTFERKDDDSFESDSTGALLNARPLQEVSPPGSVAGFEELFPRYTSLRLGQFREHSTYADTHLLKDCLDKEQARRKHCERHIQTLQNRILELQQQLAVAVSADRKKDSMIEQLDKTLAKVVDGWNRHEAERTSALRRLQTEKEAAEQALGREKEKGAETEGRLEQALSALSREQQTASLCRREKEALEEEKASLSCSVEAERQRVRSLEVEWDLERRQQETLRATLEEQQKAWAQRERQLEQQRQTLQEDSRAQLDKERAAAHREAQKAADTQRVLASVQSEVQGMEAELEAVRRERDNLKMEISLVKARHEAQKVKLESELKVALEQRVTERLAEVHEESLRQLSAMREQHRKQLLDLSSHHEKELASQLAQFKSDLAEKEERQRHLTEDYERRISRQQGEIRELQSKHRRLEVQRAEMVSQFQTLMQAHWNEALRLFAGSTASPQPCAKGPRPDPPSDPDLAPDLDCLQPSESLKKMPKVESLGSCQWSGDCEGPGWARAVPLQPAAQRSSLQRPSEAPEKAVQGTNQLFLPLTPDVGRLSSEFSHILSCSLLSQPGFQPLEPQEDHPRIDSGLTFHPENLAEHPFTDEIDETVTEAVGSEAETPQHSSLDSGGQAPQPDFSYYLRLLLDHASNESCAQKQEGSSANGLPPFTNQTQFGTSHSYHERSTALWDTAQLSTNTIRIQPPSNAAVHKTKVSLSKAGSSYPEATSPLQQDLVHQSGILSPRQVAEVSRLLKHYQAKGKPVPSTEELYKYLRGIDQNGPEMKSDGNLQARRNLDPRLTEGVRKEVGPARRLGPGREKSHPSAKAGRKLSGVPASNSRHSRGGGGVWR
ncbi:centrobin [Hemicordylus capensis]|uniref:centrobin n=1 Tax=Hemicordylus capensis TaxID=884348 RepID=UPI002302178D|nr:centrobin [Hemicordylus capensis]XP_053117188.1 centrobin [Hemicordylus capensis]